MICKHCGQQIARNRRRKERIAAALRFYNEMFLTQRDIAALLGCSQSTISRIVSPQP